MESFNVEELAESHWSKQFTTWIEQIRMEKTSGNLILKAYLDELNRIRKIIADPTRSIRTLGETEEYRTNIRLLKIIPEIVQI